MTPNRQGVVVTGLGAVTAAGHGAAALAAALRAGHGCARPYETPLPVSLAATVPEPVAPLPDFPDDRKAWLAMAALEEALQDAFPGGHDLPRGARVAVFLGTGLSSVTPDELASDIYPHLREDGSFDRPSMARDLDPRRAAPRRHLPDRVTSAVAARVGATGPVGTSFSACSASAQAIAEALWTLRRGEADVAIVGGHDAMVHPLGILSFVVLGAVSPEHCRPFDQRRDGFVIGEGAAVLVLETAEHASARGHLPRAHLLGAGTSADAWNVTAPHPDGAGAERAMRRALKDAGLTAEAVAYVNAHGTGTPIGDLAEVGAIARVFGDGALVSSIKGAVGHTIAAAGAIEAVACVLALQEGWLPGTFGLEEPDVAFPVRILVRPEEREVSVVLSNSFGFGGQNCSIVLAPAGVSRG